MYIYIYIYIYTCYPLPMIRSRSPRTASSVTCAPRTTSTSRGPSRRIRSPEKNPLDAYDAENQHTYIYIYIYICRDMFILMFLYFPQMSSVFFDFRALSSSILSNNWGTNPWRELCYSCSYPCQTYPQKCGIQLSNKTVIQSILGMGMGVNVAA